MKREKTQLSYKEVLELFENFLIFKTLDSENFNIEVDDFSSVTVTFNNSNTRFAELCAMHNCGYMNLKMWFRKDEVFYYDRFKMGSYDRKISNIKMLQFSFKYRDKNLKLKEVLLKYFGDEGKQIVDKYYETEIQPVS